jgi:hypothetical protein
MRDGRRRELVSASMSHPRRRPSLRALAFDGAVDGGAADAEQLSDLSGAVLAAVYQRDQVCFLAAVEVGLLSPQPALGLGDLHALPCPEPDQV